MDQQTLKAERRSGIGTRASRKLRSQGRLPGIIYGHGEEPVAFTIDRHDAEFELQQGHHLLNLNLDGKSDVRVVENTDRVHNLIVCTLCSCYPWPLLGVPPVWYKSFAYRSRAVVEPRAVLREFGTELPDDVEVRVWDSSAAIRYLVLPTRPAGTEHLGEDELAALVTRDQMVGVRR